MMKTKFLVFYIIVFGLVIIVAAFLSVNFYKSKKEIQKDPEITPALEDSLTLEDMLKMTSASSENAIVPKEAIKNTTAPNSSIREASKETIDSLTAPRQ